MTRTAHKKSKPAPKRDANDAKRGGGKQKQNKEIAVPENHRDITKLSDDIRQQFKDSLLLLDKKKIQRIAQRYFTIDETQKGTSVISNKANLEKANIQLKEEGRQLNLFKI